MGTAVRFFTEAAIGKLMIRVPAIEGHRLWAESYDQAPNPLLALEARTMRRILERAQPKRVIDVACGTGRWLLRLQQSGVSVFGIDACDAMLLQAAKSSSLSGRLLLGEVGHLPIRDGAADLVLCSLALGYFHNLERSIDELARICMPGGQIAICDVHPEALAAGWTRAFTRQGVRYEIDHHIYQWEQIDGAARAAGLHVLLRESARLAEPERPFFRKAEKDHLFAAAAAVPALFTGVWERPC